MMRWVLLSISLLAMGCQPNEDYATDAEVQATVNGAVSSAVPKCVPGRLLDCPCPGGTSGSQACAADGKSFAACECPPPVSLDGGPGEQIVMCDPVKQTAKAVYPGMKAPELFGVRVIAHDPNAGANPAFSVLGGEFADGFVLAGCMGDYDIFLGP